MYRCWCASIEKEQIVLFTYLMACLTYSNSAINIATYWLHREVWTTYWMYGMHRDVLITYWMYVCCRRDISGLPSQ